MKNLWFNNITLTQDDIKKFEENKFENYILYPAASWPHKNHLKLIEALIILRNKNKNINLVCTGHKNDHFNEINSLIKKNQLENNITFIGVVSDKELLYLYKNCISVVVPTLYEAGSFPLMESILIGIPVICSNVTSLPETIGNKKFIFDPNSSESIAKKVESICFDKKYRLDNLKWTETMKKRLIDTKAKEKFEIIYSNLMKDAK